MNIHMETALATIRTLADHIESTEKLMQAHGMKVSEQGNLVVAARRLADRIEANTTSPAPARKPWRFFGWFRRASN
jgi:hypothetical protein